MDKNKSHKGFAIICADNGKISEVLKDDLLGAHIGDSLRSFIDPSSVKKFLYFMSEMKKGNSEFGWEINFFIKGSIEPIYLSGIFDNNILRIIGSKDIQKTNKYITELFNLNNEQQTQLRNALKENHQYKKVLKNSEFTLNELTKINNEMLNLQRQLSKRNEELIKANDLLNDKISELDQFSYVVSHDLKAPLRGIITIIGMIKEDYLDQFPDNLNNMFGLIEKQAFNMDNMIKGILDYSRAGRINKDISTFQLSELIDEVWSILDMSNNFQLHVGKNLPEITCCRAQLHQTLSNLISNAIKHHHRDKGNVWINVKEIEKNVLAFEIKDDGPGIEEKLFSKIFQPFATGLPKAKIDSTGIGLAIVKKLVEQHKGSISVSSNLGEGAVFSFTWPMDVNKLN